MSIFEKNQALASLFEQHKARLCEEEGLTEEEIRSAIEAGTMVLLGNPNHKDVRPILVGQPSRVKVNANIGTSPFHCSVKGGNAQAQDRSGRRRGHRHGSLHCGRS